MKALYPDLNDNTITLTLNDEDIEDAQNQEGELQNIIEIPSETWDHVITEIDIPEQDYYNKIKINVEDIDESDNPNTITIQIPENPTLNQQNVLENIDVEESQLITYNENELDYGTNINIDLSEYKKNIKTLETITNTPLQSNQTTYTVSQLMTNQNADGITKDSTLYVNVPVTPSPIIGFANITENGQYEPIDFNSQGEYDPLNPNNNFDYLNQINVNTTLTYDLSKFYYTKDDGTNITYFNWIVAQNDISIPMSNNHELIVITRNPGNENNRFRITINDFWSGGWNITVKKDDIYSMYDAKVDPNDQRRYITKFWNNGKVLMKTFFNRNNITTGDWVLQNVDCYFDGVINVDIN